MRSQLNLSSLKYIYWSSACAINLGDSVILTGGMQPADHDPWTNEESKVVSKYDETGWLNDLPPLLAAIRDHACSYFDNTEGSKVDILIINTVLS